MANNFSDKYDYEIEEILGVASPQEDLHTDWCKAVVKALMTNLDDGSKENTVDIRTINANTKKCGKGIRLSIEEAHNVTNILIQNGYGSMEVLEKEYQRRKSLYEG